MLSIFLKHGEFTDIEKLKDEEKIKIARPIQNRPSDKENLRGDL
jgi:hypothetical protein